MAPPPQQRISHGNDGCDIDLSDHKEVEIQFDYVNWRCKGEITEIIVIKFSRLSFILMESTSNSKYLRNKCNIKASMSACTRILGLEGPL
ncbi:hypothetical protein HanPSC8_Chr01g0033561 [Helianthus annuus]|nr:hypothetical protein HanPSC8_Chr01g0033561 [Helianthus annuus]